MPWRYHWNQHVKYWIEYNERVLRKYGECPEERMVQSLAIIRSSSVVMTVPFVMKQLVEIPNHLIEDYSYKHAQVLILHDCKYIRSEVLSFLLRQCKEWRSVTFTANKQSDHFVRSYTDDLLKLPKLKNLELSVRKF